MFKLANFDLKILSHSEDVIKMQIGFPRSGIHRGGGKILVVKVSLAMTKVNFEASSNIST